MLTLFEALKLADRMGPDYEPIICGNSYVIARKDLVTNAELLLTKPIETSIKALTADAILFTLSRKGL